MFVKYLPYPPHIVLVPGYILDTGNYGEEQTSDSVPHGSVFLCSEDTQSKETYEIVIQENICERKHEQEIQHMLQTQFGQNGPGVKAQSTVAVPYKCLYHL